jgi:hypothetical protein
MVDGKFKHTWTGNISANYRVYGVIGDVDNDGTKEVVAIGTTHTVTGKGKNQVHTWAREWNIWKNGDDTDSPTFSFDPGFSTDALEIGDPDNDGKNELVIGGSPLRIWSFDSSGYTEEAKIDYIGSGGLTIADADNDGKNEILIGMGVYNDVVDRLGHGIVLKYVNGAYSIVGDLGPANTRAQIDEISVGDLDGDGKNELFGSGYAKGYIYIWKYTDGAYKQIWSKQEDSREFHQNNEIADVNGDGKNEFAFTTLNNYTLVVFKYAGNGDWSKIGTYDNCYNNELDAMVSADPDADGAYELIVQDTVWDWDGSVMKQIQDLNENGSADDVSVA